jgi:16S rRNA pseudouridine516 synthase
MKSTERLDKILSHMGFGTRSGIRKLVKDGAVTVNGVLVKDSGIKVDPESDIIRVRGEEVRYRKFIYLMMNKPQGVVSSTDDPRNRTVLDLLDERYAHYALFPVGRLDKDTEGLLVLSNDGRMAHRVLSPRHHVDKTYYVEVSGQVDESDRERMKQGIVLDDGYLTMPADLRILEAGPERSRVELTVREGKFHQVKRMFAALGKPVTYLKRIRMADLVLDPELAPGAYREMTEAEIALLR